MGLYVNAERIKEAVERLRESRASRGMAPFLILKRALKLVGSDKVEMSMNNEHFQKAIDDLTLWPEEEKAEQADRPFIDYPWEHLCPDPVSSSAPLFGNINNSVRKRLR